MSQNDLWEKVESLTGGCMSPSFLLSFIFGSSYLFFQYLWLSHDCGSWGYWRAFSFNVFILLLEGAFECSVRSMCSQQQAYCFYMFMSVWLHHKIFLWAVHIMQAVTLVSLVIYFSVIMWALAENRNPYLCQTWPPKKLNLGIFA